MITLKNLGIWLEAELNALELYGAEIELYVKGKRKDAVYTIRIGVYNSAYPVDLPVTVLLVCCAGTPVS